ncbi:hypothetical protein O1B32_003656 [Vibrio cholerae]|nr:hypothetical protein [Vibrio cholerae]
MLKIEVFPENVSVIIRTTQPKDDKPGREIFEQEAYAYLGGKFPVQMKLQLEKLHHIWQKHLEEIFVLIFSQTLQIIEIARRFSCRLIEFIEFFPSFIQSRLGF